MTHSCESISVPQQGRVGQRPLGTWGRLVCMFLAAGLLLLLIVAARLNPSSEGMGTHQQLGLPPCSIVLLYGIRCPACGMTTSWAHFMRGQLIAALHANVGGVLLAVMAIISAPTLAWMSIVGRTLTRGTSWFFAIGLLSIITASAAEWILRVFQPFS